MGLSSDRGVVQATSEAGNVRDVTFVETVPLKWQLRKYADKVPIVPIYDLIFEFKLHVPF